MVNQAKVVVMYVVDQTAHAFTSQTSNIRLGVDNLKIIAVIVHLMTTRFNRALSDPFSPIFQKHCNFFNLDIFQTHCHMHSFQCCRWITH